jgi:transcriptional regulator with XRE-family HTH domain
MLLCEALTKRIEHYLDERNITVYRLAKDSAMPISTLTSIMRGESKNPSFIIFYQLADGLGITVEEFLKDDVFKKENIDY